MTSTASRGSTAAAPTTAVDARDDIAAHRSDPRYLRLMQATRRAAKKGYESVSMRELAASTRMSLTTIYQFCPSKDQLIAEAHADRMERFRARLEAEPPRGQTADARVRRVVNDMVDTLEQDEVVTRTLMRALYSGDPGVAAGRAAVTASYRAIIDGAIGDDDLPDRDAVIETFGFVLDAVILDWLMPGLTSQGHDASYARGVLDRAVTVLFGRVEQP
jgi:AcrR family transcriptional regulator